MFLSIIIPTYNRAEMLRRALLSVRSQDWFCDHNGWEIIVVDDGSTDATSQLLDQHFNEVRVVTQANQGVSAARNRGVDAAAGEWIAYLDSDDVWMPHKLTDQFSALQKSDLKFCHTEELWVRNGVRVNPMRKHRKRGGWIFEHCLPLCAMSPSSVLMHRSILEDVGPFDESLPACEDYDMWLRVTAKYPVEFVVQACLTKYGGHSDQLSRQHWGMDRFRVMALEKILQQPLEAAQFSAAKAMLINKLNILKQGAAKHGNTQLHQFCQNRLVHWHRAA